MRGAQLLAQFLEIVERGILRGHGTFYRSRRDFVTCEVLPPAGIRHVARMARPSDERPSRATRQSRRFSKEASALGERVRNLRKARGWTLEAAAEAMNVDLKHLQKVEAGQVNLTLVTLVRIAHGLDVPIAALFRATRASARR